MDIGDQVPARIVVTVPWPVGHVGREALGGRQPWSFTDQEHHNGWIKNLADIVECTHPAVPDEKRLTKSPTSAVSFDCEQRKQRGNLGPHCRGRQSISNRDLKVGARATTAGISVSRRITQRAAQVGPQQEFFLGPGQCGSPRIAPIRSTNGLPKSSVRSSSAHTASRAAAWSRRSSSHVAVR